MTEPSTSPSSTETAPAAEPDPLLQLIQRSVQTSLRRHRLNDRRGIIDPEYGRTRMVNPRFQESSLLLALAGTHRIGVPEDMRPPELLTIAVRVVDVWLRSLQRSGAVQSHSSGADPQATAYGLYAAAKTLQLVSNQVPTMMRGRAEKGLRRASRFLQRSFVPTGPDTRPLRYAAIKAAATYLESSSLMQVAANVKRAGDSILRESLRRETFPDDSGAYALALAYLTLETPDPSQADLDLWKQIVGRCRLSTTPTGLMGGGAESSIASLPVLTGFGHAAVRIPEARDQVLRLEQAWAEHWYDGLLDIDVPWLTPMSYLLLQHRRVFPAVPDAQVNADPPADRVHDNGSGLRRFEDWLLRFGPGGTIGWMHHLPSGSTRVFGSPVGASLREGVWMLEGSRMRQPALTGQFETDNSPRMVVSGQLQSGTIPGIQRSPRRVGFPILRGQNTRDLIRLAPPQQATSTRHHNPMDYRREIELKDGALTIETFISGQRTHRLPVIWPGGPYGRLRVGKSEVKMGTLIQERRVREMVFSGALWPDWVLRFDRPVDVLYEPLNLPITSSPMRYLSAGCGAVDIIAEDRLHMAWRVV